jgi:hypothetical protein
MIATNISSAAYRATAAIPGGTEPSRIAEAILFMAEIQNYGCRKSAARLRI